MYYNQSYHFFYFTQFPETYVFFLFKTTFVS